MGTTCSFCQGIGKIVAKGSQCSTCDGQGRVRARSDIEVNIPAGVDHGMKMRLSGKGSAAPTKSGEPGDLFVILNVAEHTIFKRNGVDILVDAKVPLHVAMLGGSVQVPTVDGDVELTIQNGTQPGERKVMRGRGIASYNKQSAKGDQWVTMKVDIPKKLTNIQKDLLKQAFGID